MIRVIIPLEKVIIKINPRTMDDLIVEMISPVRIDLNSSQIDMKVGLLEVMIIADVMIRIVSISHFVDFWFTKPLFVLGCR